MNIATPEDKPEFFRPADSRRLFGISRTMMYGWINEGKVESKVLRQRGKLTGIRLINFDSAKAFIEAQMEAAK